MLKAVEARSDSQFGVRHSSRGSKLDKTKLELGEQGAGTLSTSASFLPLPVFTILKGVTPWVGEQLTFGTQRKY